MNRSNRWFLVALAWVCTTLVAVAAGAQSFEVKTHTLKNGMKILVQEDHSIPNVALYVFYRIGSRNERPGTTGLSHFFEHLMFKGGQKYPMGEFDRTMETNGGANNAYTTQNVTVYQDWFPRSALELIFDEEADRIRDLSFDPKLIESERDVVRNERKVSVENNNFGILNEQLWATAFTAHTYQWPVLGWDVDIVNWKLEDLRHHFEMGYSPSNATMVVSGDVTAEEIFALAEKYIEPISSHEPPPKVTTQEPEQIGERRVVVRKFGQLPILQVGYHVPQTNSPEFYPLQVLETILFTGQSSRLYQRLVDKDQLALSVGGGWDWSFDPTLFEFFIRPRAGVDPPKVEQALYDEIQRLQKGGITDQELEKAKNIRTAEFFRQMKTINGKSNVIGTYEVFLGDYHKLFNTASEYAKVTKEDVQRVARQFFNEKNRTVATLIPEAPAAGPQEKQQ